MIGLPLWEGKLVMLRDPVEPVHAAQQGVNLLLAQGEPALLRRHEAIFHCVSDSFGGEKIHQAGRALERVGGPHQCFKLSGRSGSALQFQQPAGQQGSLVFRFDAKQVPQRQIPGIFRGTLFHERFRLSAANTVSASRKPTARLRHGKTPLVQVRPERATVAGGSRKSIW